MDSNEPIGDKMKSTRYLFLFLAAGLGLALLAGLLAALSRAAPASASASETTRFARPDLSAQPESWRIECADCPHQFAESTDRMLRLDGNSLPHMAYGRDHLYYAWYDGTQWHSEIADPAASVGEEASLALDPAGKPHISYLDTFNGNLKYAYQDSGGWHNTSLYPSYPGSPTSIAVDAAGYAHISYSASPNGDLYYAYQDAAGWHNELVDNSPTVCETSSLALDSDGRPHISYCDSLSGDLRYAFRDHSGWQSLSIDTQVNAGVSSIDIDHNGYPHISYFDNLFNYDLKYAYLDATGWHTDTVDTQVNVGLFNSLDLDEDNQPHIGYWADQTLRYAYLDASGWHITTVNTTGTVGSYISLALESTGEAHIAFYGYSEYTHLFSIKYARETPSDWQVQTVDSSMTVGDGTSLALNNAGYARISYIDTSLFDLKYAYQAADGWHVQTVDGENISNGPTSLALDEGGYSHIAYPNYDPAGNGSFDLKYAFQDASGWQITTVDQAGSVGSEPDLDLDQSGYPHISYIDRTNADLKYAFLDATGWHTETVVSDGVIGWSTSLKLDDQDYPHISYHVGNQGLHYAVLDASGWHTTPVDSSPDAGVYSSLELDASGSGFIGYYDGETYDLMYAYQDGSSWITETVDSDSPTGAQPSLALDAFGTPHMSYTGDVCLTPGYCNELRYAVRLPTGWITETIDVDHKLTGTSSSLALTSDGEPRISYYDYLLGDLMYASTPMGLSGLMIAGPSTGTISRTYTFTASSMPLTATLPITYSWEATGQEPFVLTGGITQAVTYTWTTTGVKLITVTAQNPVNWVTGTHSITITEIPIAGLVASNDSPTLLGLPTTFTAIWTAGSNPVFTWDFGDRTTGLGAVVTHTFDAPGIYTATVSAENSAGTVHASTVATVITETIRMPIYLPVVLDSGP